MRCNTGLQKCFGGCKHCLAIDGPLQVKSCVGDQDITLQILGVDADGCKNLTKLENFKYTNWISDSFFQGKQTSASGFKRVCRCSWDGCNGLSALKLLKEKDLFVLNKAPIGMSNQSRQNLCIDDQSKILLLTTIASLLFQIV